MKSFFPFSSFRLLASVAGCFMAASSLTAQTSTNLSGTWEFSVVTENGTGTPTVILKQQGDSLHGTYESARGGLRQLDGTFKSGAIVFTVHPNDAGGTPYLFTGTLQSDGSVAGDVDFSGQGSATFTGSKRKSEVTDASSLHGEGSRSLPSRVAAST